MHNLYFETKRALQLGNRCPPQVAQPWVREAKDAALRAPARREILIATESHQRVARC